MKSILPKILSTRSENKYYYPFFLLAGPLILQWSFLPARTLARKGKEKCQIGNFVDVFACRRPINKEVKLWTSSLK
jgi:hypothetical protein